MERNQLTVEDYHSTPQDVPPACTHIASINIQGGDLRLDSRRARRVQELMYELSGGEERIRAVVDPKYRRTLSPSQDVGVATLEAKIVKYLFFQLHKWYCAVPFKDIPVIDYPTAIFILQISITSCLPLRLRDIKQFKKYEYLKTLLRDDPMPEGASASAVAERAAHRQQALEQLGITEPGEELRRQDVIASIIHAYDCANIRGGFTGDRSGNISSSNPRENDLRDDWKDVLPHREDDPEMLRKTWFDMRYKLAQLLLDPTIDKPREAFPLLEILVSEAETQYPDWDIMFNHHPRLVVHWIDARVLGGYFDDKTHALVKVVYDRLLRIPCLHHDRSFEQARMRLMIYLPHVHMRVGIASEPDEHERNIGIIAKCLRGKGQHRYCESVLRQILVREDQPPHPLYQALGGEEWLMSWRASLVHKRERRCMNCNTSLADNRPKRCRGCKCFDYCSVSCQKQHWPLHKTFCSEKHRSNRKMKRFKKRCPKTMAKHIGLFTKWLWELSHAEILKHALSLYRCPERGRTHIIIRQVAYVPEATELRYRFTTVKCGVFRIDHAMSDIERLLGCGPEAFPTSSVPITGAEAAMFAANELISVCTLSYGVGLNPVFDTSFVSRESLDTTMYEPRWRNMVNKWGDDPPASLTLPSGLEDAEHIW